MTKRTKVTHHDTFWDRNGEKILVAGVTALISSGMPKLVEVLLKLFGLK